MNGNITITQLSHNYSNIGQTNTNKAETIMNKHRHRAYNMKTNKNALLITTSKYKLSLNRFPQTALTIETPCWSETIERVKLWKARLLDTAGTVPTISSILILVYVHFHTKCFDYTTFREVKRNPHLPTPKPNDFFQTLITCIT